MRKEFKLPLFGVYYYLIVGNTEECQEGLDELFGGSIKTMIGPKYNGMFRQIESDILGKVIFTIEICKEANMMVIAHECLHLTNAILDLIGIGRSSDDSDETQCYIFENVYENVLKSCFPDVMHIFTAQIKNVKLPKHLELINSATEKNLKALKEIGEQFMEDINDKPEINE